MGLAVKDGNRHFSYKNNFTMACFLFLIVIVVVLRSFTGEVFKKPKPKSPEKELGEALTKYLEKGVIIRTAPDKKD